MTFSKAEYRGTDPEDGLEFVSYGVLDNSTGHYYSFDLFYDGEESRLDNDYLDCIVAEISSGKKPIEMFAAEPEPLTGIVAVM